MYYGPIKAILRTHQGYTREVAIVPPPPESISMAVSSSGTQIWNPNDLMTSEWSVFKNVKFLKKEELKGQNAWLYVQEGDPKVISAKMDDLYKALQPKLMEQIEAQITQAGPFFNYVKNKAQQATLPQVVLSETKDLTVTDNEILVICDKHKKDHGYDAYTEQQMANLGYKTPPESGEEPYAYLTRLLELVKKNQKSEQLQQQFQQAMAQYDAMKKEYEAQKKQYYEGLQQQQVFSTQTNMPSFGGGYQPLLGDPIPHVPPKIEKPKPVERPKLPDPVEPRKRLMKKS